VCLDGFVQFSRQGQEALVISAQTIDPKSSQGTAEQINLNIVGMLVSCSAVDMSLNGVVGVFPRMKESIGGVDIRMTIVVWETREKDVRLERILEETIDTGPNTGV
jgi:hypothetical protein